MLCQHLLKFHLQINSVCHKFPLRNLPMAISYARLEYVKRSVGKNAVAKSAYNAKLQLKFEGNTSAPAQIYDWSRKGEQPINHAILLPDHVDKNYSNPEKLWNEAEKFEKRKDSQVAIEVVLALPDDEVITDEQRTDMAHKFANKYFVSKGYGVQIDIHAPNRGSVYNEESGEAELVNKNTHAHLLITVRHFNTEGSGFKDKKVNDISPEVRGNTHHAFGGLEWSKLWTQFQNEYFETMGLDLRVDSPGVIPQIHLGPYRMRSRAFSLLEENENLMAQNKEESRDPQNILQSLIRNKNVFTHEDLLNFLSKHFEGNLQELNQIKDEFWQQPNIVQLFDRDSHNSINRFTTHEVIAEEKQILRIANRIQQASSKMKNIEPDEKHIKLLNEEQKVAYQGILSGQKLVCLEGHAGTGKSHLLNAIKNTYEEQGYTVRGLGPDNATAQVLNQKGFAQTQNVHQFLYAAAGKSKKNPIQIKSNREVWVVDESGKLGNAALLELVKLADSKKAHLIFSGCTAQMGAVERGDMFRVFCQRYGSLQLENIQRQEKEAHREIAKKLAHGNLTGALDQIVKTGGIHWSLTKEEAIENVAISWAKDQSAFPYQTSIIIAHTNKDVKVLNEYIRCYRLEKGEIAKQELECETMAGKVHVSKGDLIEFRKNDSNLKVSNGTRGILVEASPEKFVVQIKDKEKPREVSFDPKAYFQYQLGYATTFYRSQGDTVDRAYVLHSPKMSSEMFYVGLTRHVKNVSYFVSKHETTSISHLKMQIQKQSQRESTVDFITQEEIIASNLQREKQESIKILKQSPNFLNRIKGHSVHLWDQFVNSTAGQIDKIQDRRPNQSFYNYQGEELKKEAAVVPYIESTLTKTPYEVIKTLVEKETVTKILNDQKSVKPYEYRIDLLDPKHQGIYKQYAKYASEASAFYSIVMAETEEKSGQEKNAPHYSKWQEACGKRNESAYMLVQAASLDEIKKALPKQAFDTLSEYSSRFELLRYKQSNCIPPLDLRLKDNLEYLLERLFPEGPTSKHPQGLRFGNKGSLTVHCTGNKRGSYYDFEHQKGGGPTSLIRHILSLDAYQAKEWGEKLLGNFKHPNDNSLYRVTSRQESKTSSWTTIKPIGEYPAPTLKRISPSLAKMYTEEARYPYKNEKGELLFYVLRLVEKTNPNKKITPPLSYGRWELNKPTWSLKGFQDKLRPIYNLDKLYEMPSATVLIVEGEKTADAASKLFKNQNIVSVTFSGGAGAVVKTDWRHLMGRDVIIWPDNDQAGFKAAEQLVSELRKQGVSSLKVVDTALLNRFFPQKWDLADRLPEGIQETYIQDLILRANDKTLGLHTLLAQAYQVNKDFDPKQPANVLFCREILSRLENRQWASLESRVDGKIWEIKSAIQADALQLISNARVIQKEMNTLGLPEETSRTLAFGSSLVQANQGSELKEAEMQKMKAASFQICRSSKELPYSKNEMEIFRLMAVAAYVDSGTLSSSKEDSKEIFEKIKQLSHSQIESLHEMPDKPLTQVLRKQIDLER